MTSGVHDMCATTSGVPQMVPKQICCVFFSFFLTAKENFVEKLSYPVLIFPLFSISRLVVVKNSNSCGSILRLFDFSQVKIIIFLSLEKNII